jgi:hypothetical protein
MSDRERLRNRVEFQLRLRDLHTELMGRVFQVTQDYEELRKTPVRGSFARRCRALKASEASQKALVRDVGALARTYDLWVALRNPNKRAAGGALGAEKRWGKLETGGGKRT